MNRYAMPRIDAHQNGDCDAATCPLCELEDRDRWACDSCGDGFHGEPPDACWHGQTLCDECACSDCATEARRP